MLTAFVEVICGWGYTVQISNSGVIVDEYQAGDSPLDSSVFGTGKMSREELMQEANENACEMLEDHGAFEPYQIETQVYESFEMFGG